MMTKKNYDSTTYRLPTVAKNMFTFIIAMAMMTACNA